MPTSDVAEPFISVTDVKQYLYCPRIVYFERVLHAKPQLGSQQEESRRLHEEYRKKELRRKDAIYYRPEFSGAEKLLFTSLTSSSLGLRGVLDCIIKTENSEYIPVDYKNMLSAKGRIWMHHKYQLVAYALLIEAHFETKVRRGFITYLPEKLTVKLNITPSTKTHVRRVIGYIKRIIKEETPPRIRVAEHKCKGGCGHMKICKRH